MAQDSWVDGAWWRKIVGWGRLVAQDSWVDGAWWRKIVGGWAPWGARIVVSMINVTYFTYFHHFPGGSRYLYTILTTWKPDVETTRNQATLHYIWFPALWSPPYEIFFGNQNCRKI